MGFCDDHSYSQVLSETLLLRTSGAAASSLHCPKCTGPQTENTLSLFPLINSLTLGVVRVLTAQPSLHLGNGSDHIWERKTKVPKLA